MTCRKIYIQEDRPATLAVLATGSVESLITYLVAESGRPGPCANRDLTSRHSPILSGSMRLPMRAIAELSWSLCTRTRLRLPRGRSSRHILTSPSRSAGFSAIAAIGGRHNRMLPKWPPKPRCRMPPSTPVSGWRDGGGARGSGTSSHARANETVAGAGGVGSESGGRRLLMRAAAAGIGRSLICMAEPKLG